MGPIFIKILLSDLTMFGAKNRAEITNFMKLLNLLHLGQKLTFFDDFQRRKSLKIKNHHPTWPDLRLPFASNLLTESISLYFPELANL